jgi:hypothetical protein
MHFEWNLAVLIRLEAHRENDRVVTTTTFTPRPLNLLVAVLSLFLLAVPAGYAEQLGPV